MKSVFITILLIFFSIITLGQEINPNVSINYLQPKEYEIGGVTISGVEYLDQNVLLYLTGLEIGKKISIPGEEISSAIKKLWEQDLFSDVKISLTRVVNDIAFLDINLKERPRLSRYAFSGIKKKEADDIRELVKLTKGTQVTENVIMTSNKHITDYFVDKGYRNVEINATEEIDTLLANSVILTFNVKPNQRIKINQIIFEGNNDTVDEKKWYQIFNSNQVMSDAKLRRKMKNTKQKAWYNIFKSSKLIPKSYEEDKLKIIEVYNEKGYRDAKIIYDSIAKHNDKTINLYIGIDEGAKYYFRNISWIGNTKYSSDVLTKVLGIEPGDLYNRKLLEEKLYYDPAGVMSLYQDDGYLFSNISPVEVLVQNDSIDIEMRVYEGKQARINKVTVSGNARTNDHVVIRELRTRPGSLYNRSDVQRTIRELAQLGYFNAEKLNVDFQPDPVEGTVDLEFLVEEQPSDQVEISGGWGGGIIIGSIGLSFNNFSLRNMFNLKSYRPIPSGDGQRITLRAQAGGYGTSYRNLGFSFVEPWFGGKKPNSLAFSVSHSIMSNNAKEKENLYSFKTTAVALGLGQRLKVPDDYFTIYNEIGYKFYNLHNYRYIENYPTGIANNISFKSVLGRHSSGPNPIFPTVGSTFSLSVELTPPYSLFNNKNYSDEAMTLQERYKWIEYHKYRLTGEWYTTLVGSRDGSSRALVLLTKFDFGYVASYNKSVGPPPFEGFQVGGDGITGGGFYMYGFELVSLRGYEPGYITPSKGGNIFNKFTAELRYPLTLSPTATFYAIIFAEAGNAWYSSKEFNPFSLRKSAGVGVRVYMPMIGMLGVDWGYGLDKIPGLSNQKRGQLHFVLGQQF
jgi:outer membrane protein insertion porin family